MSTSGSYQRATLTLPGAQAATTTAAAKPLLSFSITPPRKNGPSDAEKKVEELTKQLEEELEKREEAEYFGTKLWIFLNTPSFCMINFTFSILIKLLLSNQVT